MRKATLLTAFLLLTAMSAGCEPDGTNSERPIHCEVLVDAPEKAEDADQIVGRVRFSCDKPGAEKLTLKVKLEKRDGDGDQWHSVGSASFTLRGLDTHKGGWDRHSREAQANCDTGTYRTVVDWSRVSRGNTRGDNLVSGVSRDPCD